MKWLIASDIHGSAHWCRKLLEAFEQERAERIILLGDILYHGPRNDLPAEYDPKAVAAMLNAHRNEILCVRGNCEAEVDQMMLQFPVMADYGLLADGERLIYMTHGHLPGVQKLLNADGAPAGATDGLPLKAVDGLPLKAGDVLLYGHTHVPAWEKKGDIFCLNPGSVSIPKQDSWHGYMTFENGEFCWKDMDGNVKHGPENSW